MGVRSGWAFLGTKCDKTQRTSHSACRSAAWPQKWEGKTLTATQWKLHHHIEGWMLRLPSSPKHLRAAPKHWTWSIKPNHQFPSRRCCLLPVLHRLFVIGIRPQKKKKNIYNQVEHCPASGNTASRCKHSWCDIAHFLLILSLSPSQPFCANRSTMERKRERERGRYTYV